MNYNRDMEITLPHNELIRALELISRISTKHVTLPVLQCAHLVANDDSILIQATNLEINIEIQLSGTVMEAGEVAIPSQVFMQSVQFVSDKELTLRTEDQVLLIETSRTNTSIKLFPTDEFPNFSQLQGEEQCLQGRVLSNAIKSVAFAASSTSIKPELGSVFMEQKKEHALTLVATDSFRLMEKTCSQKSLLLSQSIMIPQRNALELSRIIDVVGEDPVLVVSDDQCALRFPSGVYVSSRLVNGSFPDYAQIIPKEFSTHVTVLKEDLLRSFKKTSIFLNKFRQVSLTVSEQNLTISSENSEVGHVTDTIPAQVEGEEIRLNFNQQYITDPLTHIADDSVKLSFAGVGRAMILAGLHDTSIRYLVMPMNK